MTYELKSCPFCAKPLAVRNGVNPYGRCDTEGCWMAEAKIGISCDDPKQVERWNTRPAPAATDTGLETVEHQYWRDQTQEWLPTGFPDLYRKDGFQVRELVTRSQAEELLAAERGRADKAEADAEKYREYAAEKSNQVAVFQQILPAVTSERDYWKSCATKAETIFEGERRMRRDLEAKLAAAEKVLERIAARDGIPLAGSFAAEIARAVLGGKP